MSIPDLDKILKDPEQYVRDNEKKSFDPIFDALFDFRNRTNLSIEDYKKILPHVTQLFFTALYANNNNLLEAVYDLLSEEERVLLLICSYLYHDSIPYFFVKKKNIDKKLIIKEIKRIIENEFRIQYSDKNFYINEIGTLIEFMIIFDIPLELLISSDINNIKIEEHYQERVIKQNPSLINHIVNLTDDLKNKYKDLIDLGNLGL